MLLSGETWPIGGALSNQHAIGDDDPNGFIISGGEFTRDWEGLYSNIDDPWGQEESASRDIPHFLSLQLLQSITKIRGGEAIRSILDVGCATGYHSVDYRAFFPQAGYWGVDVSGVAIRTARERYGRDQIVFMDENFLSPSEALSSMMFDAVVSSRTIYYMGPEIREVVERVDQLLRPGGVFLWTYNYRPDSFSRRFLSPDSLSDLLESCGLRLLSVVQYRTPGDDEIVDIRIHEKQQQA